MLVDAVAVDAAVVAVVDAAVDVECLQLRQLPLLL